MKAEDFMRTTNVPLFPKEMMHKSFLYDGKEHVKPIKVDNKREDNNRYAIKVIFESQGRRLILTKRALFDLFSAVKAYPGTIVTVRFDGKTGEKKGTHWLFSVVTDEKPFNWSAVMGTTAKQSEPAKDRKIDVTTLEGTLDYLKNYKRGMII